MVQIGRARRKQKPGTLDARCCRTHGPHLTTFGTWLREARTAAGLSQAKLGNEVGIYQARVSLFERDKIIPKPAEVEALQDELGARVSGLPPAPLPLDTSLGFEARLWDTVANTRGTMAVADHKRLVFGLLFLRLLSPSSPDGLTVPRKARWSHLLSHTRKKTPGESQRLRDALDRIEELNPILHGATPTIPDVEDTFIRELVLALSSVEFEAGDRDVLGQVYEYFLRRHATADDTGEHYTPPCLVQLMVDMLETHQGKVYDPCCGSGGLLVQAHRLFDAPCQADFFGQEANPTAWSLARLNMAIREIDADLGGKAADTLLEDLHPDLQADHVLSNPPFNMTNWGRGRLQDDPRWRYGLPPHGNANFAWVQHIVHHLGPDGSAAIILANRSLSAMRAGEGSIRQRLVEADLVDCIVSLPRRLFANTRIPVCLWILTRNKAAVGHRDRRGDTLFIDARGLGRADGKGQVSLDREDTDQIAAVYRAWRDEDGIHEDEAGFCRSVDLEEIKCHDFVLVPSQYVVGARKALDAQARGEQVARLATSLRSLLAESRQIDGEIESLLGDLLDEG